MKVRKPNSRRRLNWPLQILMSPEALWAFNSSSAQVVVVFGVWCLVCTSFCLFVCDSAIGGFCCPFLAYDQETYMVYICRWYLLVLKKEVLYTVAPSINFMRNGSVWLICLVKPIITFFVSSQIGSEVASYLLRPCLAEIVSYLK